MKSNKDQFVKGEVVAIYGLLIFGISMVIELLLALNFINPSTFLIYLYSFCLVISFPVMGYGCFFMAKGKGYHPAIGILLSLIIIGPVLLSYFPYRKTGMNN